MSATATAPVTVTALGPEPAKKGKGKGKGKAVVGAVEGGEKKKKRRNKKSAAKRFRLLSLISNVKKLVDVPGDADGKLQLRSSAKNVLESLHTEIAERLAQTAALLADSQGKSTLTVNHIRVAAGVLIHHEGFLNACFRYVDRKLAALPEPVKPVPKPKAPKTPVAAVAVVPVAAPVPQAPATAAPALPVIRVATLPVGIEPAGRVPVVPSAPVPVPAPAPAAASKSIFSF